MFTDLRVCQTVSYHHVLLLAVRSQPQNPDMPSPQAVEGSGPKAHGGEGPEALGLGDPQVHLPLFPGHRHEGGEAVPMLRPPQP